jgi:hypothetical protein
MKRLFSGPSKNSSPTIVGHANESVPTMHCRQSIRIAFLRLMDKVFQLTLTPKPHFCTGNLEKTVDIACRRRGTYITCNPVLDRMRHFERPHGWAAGQRIDVRWIHVRWVVSIRLPDFFSNSAVRRSTSSRSWQGRRSTENRNVRPGSCL